MMFVVVLYDISVEEKMHNKVLKLLRQYLHHIQKSCFHGYISHKSLRKLLDEIDDLELEKHHIIVYIMRSNKYLKIIERGDKCRSDNNIF